MKNPFFPGDTRKYSITVEDKDVARFESGLVHPVYATFALARDIEWACRLFVLEMKEEHEEGIGTMLSIEHISPAFKGSRVDIIATAKSITGNEIICTYEARVGNRLIARGEQGQKVLPKDKIDRVFENAKKNEV
jgi:fluoroacetyl-CoA thioesterase